eukprot:gene5235-biopygen5575
MSTMISSQALSKPSRRPYRSLAIELDLCLYRTVSERWGGRILPFPVRQLIKDYSWVSFNNETQREAVRLWCSDRELARQWYGEINDWNVSRETNMNRLFADINFNDRING